jgi:hypothetical protein
MPKNKAAPAGGKNLIQAGFEAGNMNRGLSPQLFRVKSQ